MNKRAERAAFIARQKARVLARKPPNRRRWYVFHVNCDCCSYDHARPVVPQGTFMKCSHCKRSLGDMEAIPRGHFNAVSESEAIEMADKHEESQSGPRRSIVDRLLGSKKKKSRSQRISSTGRGRKLI